jgi:hypothetical protein
MARDNVSVAFTMGRFTEEAMPNPNAQEITAIEEAYEDELKAMFKILVANLASEAVTHDTDKLCMEKFRVGLHLTRRAKELALNAVANTLVA